MWNIEDSIMALFILILFKDCCEVNYTLKEFKSDYLIIELTTDLTCNVLKL